MLSESFLPDVGLDDGPKKKPVKPDTVAMKAKRDDEIRAAITEGEPKSPDASVHRQGHLDRIVQLNNLIGAARALSSKH